MRSASATSSANPMSSQPPKSANVKKKKKNPFDDDYIQADLNWFKDKQAVHSEPPISAETQGDSNGEAITTQSPSTGETSTLAGQRNEVSMRQRSRSRSPSIPLLQVMQAKLKSSPPAAASKTDKPKFHAG
ncbi:hypothetical protein L226DRAFT_58226 [Lentinus tigrinus ALCF2SS1-7]|uniref:uncharacterized protein n=1 Tax=Lentinus tigrinus ALCF2SS1-7 TaxID=1328758 RepID=UPI0011660818|nr:hypothetical protein L226DRAFT_58226 [Lentinus tigrinus ALCF2SS1-7]